MQENKKHLSISNSNVMKKFILKVLTFITTTILMFILFWMLICSTRDKLMRLPNDEQIVFLGNSHIECAVNDSLVKNSFNFGRSDECAEFVYSKVKLLDKYNPQIDTIIIGYDNIILMRNSKKSFKDQLYHPYYYDTYNFDDILKISELSSFPYIESHLSNPFYWSKIIDIIPSFIKKKDISDLNNLGGYLYLIRDKLPENISLSRNKEHKPSQVDKLQQYFLDQIIKYCDDNDLTLIFMCPPQHNKCLIDSALYRETYNERYSDIPFYDFRNLYLPDSCFGDLDHLNYKGAKVFSEYIEKEILHKQNYK